MKFIVQILLVALIVIALASFSPPSGESKDIDVCLSEVEMELFNLINDYRVDNGLERIALSTSLSFVAQAHSKDLDENYTRSKRCNMHSWSKEGAWSSCCYTTDHKKASCMWDKPRELTDYTGDGFEIAFAKYKSDNSDPKLTATEALEGWKKSSGHNMVIVNKGSFKKMKWEAMGVGMYNGYATVWFGAEKDLLNEPVVCD